MEDQQQREAQYIEVRKNKYQIGNANKGGGAFNIINLNYDNSREGDFLKQKDYDSNVRQLLRSKNVDTLSNS